MTEATKWDRFITDTLGNYVEFVPVCPEVECGLRVPREALHLEGNPADPCLVTIRTKTDHYRKNEKLGLKADRRIGKRRALRIYL